MLQLTCCRSAKRPSSPTRMSRRSGAGSPAGESSRWKVSGAPFAFLDGSSFRRFGRRFHVLPMLWTPNRGGLCSRFWKRRTEGSGAELPGKRLNRVIPGQSWKPPWQRASKRAVNGRSQLDLARGQHVRRIRITPGKFVAISPELAAKAARVTATSLTREQVVQLKASGPKHVGPMAGSLKPLALRKHHAAKQSGPLRVKPR